MLRRLFGGRKAAQEAQAERRRSVEAWAATAGMTYAPGEGDQQLMVRYRDASNHFMTYQPAGTGGSHPYGYVESVCSGQADGLDVRVFDFAGLIDPDTMTWSFASCALIDLGRDVPVMGIWPKRWFRMMRRPKSFKGQGVETGPLLEAYDVEAVRGDENRARAMLTPELIAFLLAMRAEDLMFELGADAAIVSAEGPGRGSERVDLARFGLLKDTAVGFARGLPI